MTAAIKATDKIKAKARRYAAHMLEASVDDIEIDGAEYRVKGSPDRKKTIQEIAFALDLAFDAPEGMEPYLDETAYYDTPNCTWPFGTHIAVVEIDEETGVVDLVRYLAVDDVGNKINPLIVDGQLHGGIAQGVGQALWEERHLQRRRPAPDGLDARLRAAQGVEAADRSSSTRRCTPSPVNPLGVKGVGEAGAIASTAAVANAVIDALSDLGIRHLDMPYTAQKVWSAIAVGEGRPGVIPAAFEYQRATSLDDALAALAGGDAKVLAGGHEPPAADEAAAGLARARSSTSAGSTSCKGVRPDGRRRLRGRRADDLRRAPRLADGLGLPRECVPGDRRHPGPQPRDDRRVDQPCRPGLGPAGPACSLSTTRSSCARARRADGPGRRVLPGRLHDGHRPGRDPHRGASAVRSPTAPAARIRS